MENTAIAYDATLKKAACFCNDGYSGDACETPASSGKGPTETTTVANGINVFGWIVFVQLWFLIAGLVWYHRRETGELLFASSFSGGGGGNSGGTGSGYSNL